VVFSIFQEFLHAFHLLVFPVGTFQIDTSGAGQAAVGIGRKGKEQVMKKLTLLGLTISRLPIFQGSVLKT